MSLSAAERARYQRHLTLAEIGLAGQERLKAARVLVIGAGGLGSPAAMYLAAAGIGTLGVVDCDRVDLSNLHRQLLFGTAEVGAPKAEAARLRLESLNPEIAVVAHALELRAANAREVLRGYDLILDGTDRLATRYLVNDACVMLAKPLVSAAIHRFEGQVTTFVPGRGPCYRCIFPAAQDGIVASCAEAGVLGVLPGVLGAIQATEAVKLITGAGAPLVGRLLTYDALEMSFREFPITRRRECAVCGDRPTITALRDEDAACGLEEAAARVRRLSPVALRGLLGGVAELSATDRARAGAAGEMPATGRARTAVPVRAADELHRIGLIDVREPREFALGHIEGSINIPIDELARRLAEIPREVTPVFICRSGRRSLAACALAVARGIDAPAHLEGGLLAWASEVDPSLTLDPPGAPI